MVMKPIFAIVLLLLTIIEAKAQSRETLVRSKDWFGFKYTEGDSYSCYMTTEPIAKQGKHNNRGYVNAYVTHRPLYGEYDEVSFHMGHPIKKNSANLVINSNDYSLVTAKNWAFSQNKKTDKDIIAAMKRGSKMVVFSTSNLGSRTKDTYSLMGFTKVYNGLKNACK